MAAVEQKKSYFVSKDFRGINVKNNRTAIEQGEFAWLENTQPIGYGNVKIVNAPQNVANVAFANTVTYMASANINNTEFMFGFEENGAAQYVDLTTNTLGNLAAANTFSNADVQIVQWKNDRILIIDPARGYKTWDGTNLNSIGSIGSVTINNGGSNYTNVVVTIGGPGEPGGVTATAEAVLVGNAIADIIIRRQDMATHLHLQSRSQVLPGRALTSLALFLTKMALVLPLSLVVLGLLMVVQFITLPLTLLMTLCRFLLGSSHLPTQR
jgi:hypothetical protein